MSYPRPSFGNRLPSDQNVRSGSAAREVRLPNPRGRGRGRSQSISEPYSPDTRTTNSNLTQQAVGEETRNQGSSETGQSSREILHRRVVRGGPQSIQSSFDTRPTNSDITQQIWSGNLDASETSQLSGERKTLCDFCGDTIKGEDLTHVQNKLYHKDCISVHIPNCDKAIELFREFKNSKVPILRLGINVSFLCGQKKQDKNNKTKRATKIVELLHKATALLNSGSGYIFIHLVGLAPGDNFSGFFDEFADVKLNGLINDGSSFADVYKKELLSESAVKELQEFTDILVLFVDAAEFLVTSDTKTKTALDDCIIDTPDLTLRKFLQKERQFEQKYHKLPIDSPDYLCSLRESREIQAKACFQPTDRADKLVSSLYDTLRLSEYISAFSKLVNGGSYLLGLAEEVNKEGHYKSKRLSFKPAVIRDCEHVENLIVERMKQTVLLCDYKGQQLGNDGLIRIEFIPVTDKNQPPATTDNYVIHISVRSVSGVVFHEKDGPVAYRVDTKSGCISRFSVAEWFKAVRQRIETPQ